MAESPDTPRTSPAAPDTSTPDTPTRSPDMAGDAPAAPSQPPAEPAPIRSAGRRWLFRLIAIIAAPLFALFLLEGGLRVVGYGEPDTMFVRSEDGATIATRSRYGRRFFPPALLRVPLPHEFSAKKQGDAYRIFVLGGSAAKGVPETAFSFARMLDVMLTETFPDRNFEVINTSLTAINSHVVLPIAEECAKYEPDLFIVYMGNNEVVGPFGPGTVFDAFTANRKAIRGSALLRRSRTGQLMANVAGKFASNKDELRVWKGMELFLDNLIRADDPRLATAYSHLHDNLTDIIDVGRDAGAEVVVCTVASNLKDNPPFASMHGVDAFASEADRNGWQLMMNAADAAWAAGDYGSAAANAREAVALDDNHAGAQYRLAISQLRLGNADAARDRFTQARELDALRFRADDGVNDAIRIAAGERKATLVDIVERAAESSGDGIPGDELFWEHVHLNFDGNYLVASALFDAVINAMPRGGEVDNALYALPSREVVAARLAFTTWNEFKMADSIAALMARPPFTNQFDHEQRLAAMWRHVAELRGRLNQDVFIEIDATYQDAVERRPNDTPLRAQYAAFLAEVGEREESIAQWRRLVDGWPDRFDWRVSLARTLVDAGRVEDAVREFEHVTTLTPHSADAFANLGAAYMQAMRFGDAAGALDHAIELDPGHAMAHAQLADIALRGGDERGGIEHLKKAVTADPALIPAVQQLSWLLATHADDSIRDAAESSRIIEAIPDDVVQRDTRLLDALAAAKAHLGDFNQAVTLARIAEQLAVQQNNLQAAQAIAVRRAMYEQGRVFTMQ